MTRVRARRLRLSFRRSSMKRASLLRATISRNKAARRPDDRFPVGRRSRISPCHNRDWNIRSNRSADRSLSRSRPRPGNRLSRRRLGLARGSWCPSQQRQHPATMPAAEGTSTKRMTITPFFTAFVPTHNSHRGCLRCRGNVRRLITAAARYPLAALPVIVAATTICPLSNIKRASPTPARKTLSPTEIVKEVAAQKTE